MPALTSAQALKTTTYTAAMGTYVKIERTKPVLPSHS
jgi:hypothetical protein